MVTNCKAYTDTLRCGGEPTSGNPYMYTGREYDPETGLYFFRNRYQSPILGRFISEDPIGVQSGLNFYAYVGGDPVNFTDPWGLDPACTYDVSEGRMRCYEYEGQEVHDSGGWVSGRGGCQNNSTEECFKKGFFGPIPSGDYMSTSKPSHREPSTDRRWLIPYSTNEMYGRDNFQTHGCKNTKTCSQGCLGQTDENKLREFNELRDPYEWIPVLVVP